MTILNSGKYSLATFLDPNINLWQVNITNNYTGTETKDLRLEVEMLKDGVKVVWGVSKPIKLKSNTTSGFETIPPKTNMNFTGTDLSADSFDDGFYNEVQSSGILPPGEYTLIIRSYILGLWENSTSNTYEFIDKPGRKVDMGYEDEVTATFENKNIDEKIELHLPGNMSTETLLPTFRWWSPAIGTSENLANPNLGVEYRLKVALFDPELHSSLEDAMNDDINIYFDSGWYQDLTYPWAGPDPNLIQIQYPPNERELSCGYQYCWRVEARELIITESYQELDFNGNGIWGWPEPAKSDEIYSFNYGASLEINSPSSYINSVLPTFSFSGSGCAIDYEIWLSDVEDSGVDNPIWKSDYFENTSYTYPPSAIGLTPGGTYFWKVRVNPSSNPGPWSNILSFTINDISPLSPSSQEVINTLFPTFNISSPSNILEYQLLISDNTDLEVNEYNILSENLDFFPYDFPINNDIMLSPGKTYFWKVQTIDENGILTRLISDNTNVFSFSVKPIELTFPDNGSFNISLTPLFSWDAPIGITSYVIEFTNEYDQEFNDIIFNTTVNSPFFLSSNLSNSLPFENGSTYLWRVRPINNGQEGEASNYFSFSTILDDSDLNTYSSETNYEQVDFEILLSGLQGKDINISIINEVDGVDTYLIQLSDDSDMNNIIDEIYLDSSLQSYSFSGESLEWAEDYYIQVLSYSNNEIIGQPSNIKMVVMPFEPGSQEQVEFNIELIHEMISSLIIDISNPITSATNYILRLSESSDMSNYIFSELINNTSQYIYEDLDDLLNFGETYYAQLIPLKDGQSFGITSNINSIFIPNIIPPQPSDTPFYFEYSNPQSSSYIIEISTTEDFSVIYYNNITETNNINIQNELFSPGTPYYWRIRGLDNNGSPFGSYSNPKYFVSSGETTTIDESDGISSTVILENPANGMIISTKNPLFTWENYDNAEKYEIIVSTSLELNDIVWNSQNIFINSSTYPNSGAEVLDYNTLYYWAIRPINNNIALASFSDPFSFSISPNFIPELTSPKDISDDIRPYFSWTRIQNATAYGLILSVTEDYSNIIYSNQNINDNIFQYPDEAPSLSYNTEYFWKVIALSDDGSELGDYSNTTSFTTPNGIIKLEFIFGEE